MQQAIIWANADPNPYRHVASQGHNELKNRTCQEPGYY